ncbi:hypothetical protein RHMOL_Rhmol13G0101000 [Rhododendron molle]|uniref:Uncharacterized protein n=3 Tax=Rhododendron molle TaxID=49168 RepID=A0ACC0L650_RHOML|nr:hypothetical protein RHMOL_Rhmol13G0101000 [Rhododendron molle]KAI8523810.1 hypothetical protein RHMOL_Rhmol13G0101000 [Rhododendron molle]KAI8523811.1 hypothetical protein RHMOL_Rhmol13G0101000 [Rhododendron molle]
MTQCVRPWELLNGRKSKASAPCALVCEAMALREACLMVKALGLRSVQIEMKRVLCRRLAAGSISIYRSTVTRVTFTRAAFATMPSLCSDALLGLL